MTPLPPTLPGTTQPTQPQAGATATPPSTGAPATPASASTTPLAASSTTDAGQAHATFQALKALEPLTIDNITNPNILREHLDDEYKPHAEAIANTIIPRLNNNDKENFIEALSEDGLNDFRAVLYFGATRHLSNELNRKSYIEYLDHQTKPEDFINALVDLANGKTESPYNIIINQILSDKTTFQQHLPKEYKPLADDIFTTILPTFSDEKKHEVALSIIEENTQDSTDLRIALCFEVTKDITRETRDTLRDHLLDNATDPTEFIKNLMGVIDGVYQWTTGPQDNGAAEKLDDWLFFEDERPALTPANITNPDILREHLEYDYKPYAERLAVVIKALDPKNIDNLAQALNELTPYSINSPIDHIISYSIKTIEDEQLLGELAGKNELSDLLHTLQPEQLVNALETIILKNLTFTSFTTHLQNVREMLGQTVADPSDRDPIPLEDPIATKGNRPRPSLATPLDLPAQTDWLTNEEQLRIHLPEEFKDQTRGLVQVIDKAWTSEKKQLAEELTKLSNGEKTDLTHFKELLVDITIRAIRRLEENEVIDSSDPLKRVLLSDISTPNEFITDLLYTLNNPTDAQKQAENIIAERDQASQQAPAPSRGKKLWNWITSGFGLLNRQTSTHTAEPIPAEAVQTQNDPWACSDPWAERKYDNNPHLSTSNFETPQVEPAGADPDGRPTINLEDYLARELGDEATGPKGNGATGLQGNAPAQLTIDSMTEPDVLRSHLPREYKQHAVAISNIIKRLNQDNKEALLNNLNTDDPLLSFEYTLLDLVLEQSVNSETRDSISTSELANLPAENLINIVERLMTAADPQIVIGEILREQTSVTTELRADGATGTETIETMEPAGADPGGRPIIFSNNDLTAQLAEHVSLEAFTSDEANTLAQHIQETLKNGTTGPGTGENPSPTLASPSDSDPSTVPADNSSSSNATIATDSTNTENNTPWHRALFNGVREIARESVGAYIEAGKAWMNTHSKIVTGTISTIKQSTTNGYNAATEIAGEFIGNHLQSAKDLGAKISDNRERIRECFSKADYYGVLGITDRNASPETIQSTFETLLNSNPALDEETINAIRLAHRVLSDPLKRATYDLSVDVRALGNAVIDGISGGPNPPSPPSPTGPSSPTSAPAPAPPTEPPGISYSPEPAGSQSSSWSGQSSSIPTIIFGVATAIASFIWGKFSGFNWKNISASILGVLATAGGGYDAFWASKKS